MIGAAVTGLLAWGNHALTARHFIDGLTAHVEATLGHSSVSAKVGSYFALSREVTLYGDTDDATRRKLMTEVSAIPGVANTKWLMDSPVGAAMTPAIAADTAPAIAPVRAQAAPPAPKTAEASTCQASVDRILAGETIQFRSGSAYLSPPSLRIIDGLAAALKPCSGARVAITGHTDAQGDAGINRSLSQERADRVRMALVERGLNTAMLTAKGYGPDRPLAGKLAGDPLNRRIEFAVSAASGGK